MATRYAIYFVPAADTTLWRFGSEVLGYDAYSEQEVPQWHPEGIAPRDWHAMTEDPRLYGFHATLKAPFRLADGWNEGHLVAALEAFTATQSAVALGPWTIKPIASSSAARAFLAMVPASPPPGLAVLERAVVKHFDAMRAPLTQSEIARRNPARLSERQREYLDAYGYPYVLEEFRFHMTLSGAIENAAEIGETLAARAKYLGVEPPLHLDRLGLFKQEDGGRFRVMEVARFRG